MGLPLPGPGPTPSGGLTTNSRPTGLLASSPAWQDDAEQLLRQAISEGERGAAVELSQLLRKKGCDAEADSTLRAAAKAGDPEALYWHARELADAGDSTAESEIRRSIGAGNVFSNYDLGMLLADDPPRRGEAEQAFRAAVDAGYDIARNDLGIFLCEWPGREREGEAILADAGRRGQTRSWANLATYLHEHGRNAEAIAAMRAAAEDGYLHAYGTLAYFLEELGRFSDALAAFRARIEAGELALKAHLASFCERHPEVAGSDM